MEKSLPVLLMLSFLLSASSSFAQHSVNAAKTAERQQVLLERLSHSVVVVETLKFDPEKKEFSIISDDSGVVVLPNQVITNRHVVDAGEAWRIKLGEKSWRAIVTDLDPDHDLALLRAVDESLQVLTGSAGLDATPVSLRLSPTVITGEHVYAIGSTDGQQVSTSEGIVSGFRDYQLGHLIQTSAPLYLSSSGGGLFDLQGRLVGITSRSLSEGHNLNFALPAEWAHALVSPQTTAASRQPVGESEALSRALTAAMNLQTMVFERRLLHDRPSNPVSARAASWLVTSSHLKCVRDMKSLDCFDNWPLWKRASLLMLDLREDIKRAQPATDELEARFIDSARSAWSDVSDVYCAAKPGGIYTDLENKIRTCPNARQ